MPHSHGYSRCCRRAPALIDHRPYEDAERARRKASSSKGVPSSSYDTYDTGPPAGHTPHITTIFFFKTARIAPCLDASLHRPPSGEAVHSTDRRGRERALAAGDGATRTRPQQLARTCMHTCMHACMHACTHTYIHTYIHAYIHTSVAILAQNI